MTDKKRIFVLTDIGPMAYINGGWADNDDFQSFIRFLHYTNHFDVEGLAATTNLETCSPESLEFMIDRYGEVLPNLRKHDNSFPSAESLKSVVCSGLEVYGQGAKKGVWFIQDIDEVVGENSDTSASRLIIEAVDKEDERPLWVVFWGGSVDLAQALWRVRQDRSPEELEAFISKLRVFWICYNQDSAFAWITKSFPNIFSIVTGQSHKSTARGSGLDESLRDKAWIDKHLHGHGPLCDIYPYHHKEWTKHGVKEGDSFTFYHFIAKGLNDIEQPGMGGWGGRFGKTSISAYDQHPKYGKLEAENLWEDAEDDNPHGNEPLDNIFWAPARFLEPRQNDFQARADWCVKDYDQANHPPRAILNGDESHNVLYQTVEAGQSANLSAKGSSDPDGDALSYRWWRYVEADTYSGSGFAINDPASETPSVQIPADSSGATIHLVLEVHDNGTPALRSYRRIVFAIQ